MFCSRLQALVDLVPVLDPLLLLQLLRDARKPAEQTQQRTLRTRTILIRCSRRPRGRLQERRTCAGHVRNLWRTCAGCEEPTGAAVGSAAA